jgi:hypothetical protein
MARAPQSGTRPSGIGPSESAAIDRLRRLSVILPAMAQEIAAARREAARLRVENAQLLNRVSRLERRRAGETELGRQALTERR